MTPISGKFELKGPKYRGKFTVRKGVVVEADPEIEGFIGLKLRQLKSWLAYPDDHELKEIGPCSPAVG